MIGRCVHWMTVRIEELGDRRFSEGLLVDVKSGEGGRWYVIVRDLPLVGIGATPAEAWDDLERHYWRMERWIQGEEPAVSAREETPAVPVFPKLRKVLKHCETA